MLSREQTMILRRASRQLRMEQPLREPPSLRLVRSGLLARPQELQLELMALLLTEENLPRPLSLLVTFPFLLMMKVLKTFSRTTGSRALTLLSAKRKFSHSFSEMCSRNGSEESNGHAQT
jgi:hypothetical protein